MATNVTLTAGSLPQGYCFSTLQQYYEDIIAATLAELPGDATFFNFGPDLPDPSDQDKPWIRTDASGNFDRLYTYNGAWVSPHPVPASDSERRIWVGTEEELWSYDGGDGGDPATATDTSGSFWAIDTDFAFAIPMGAGTNATTYDGNPATTLAVGGTAGEERHTITEDELPEHTHVLGNSGYNNSGVPVSGGEYISAKGNGDPGGSDTSYYLVKSLADAAPDVGKVAETGSDLSHQNLPPVRGVHFIKRSARVYYTVS